ncbi:MAG: hypothetical protein QW356_09000, partial [Candidatus Hadarchaeales archaeon]
GVDGKIYLLSDAGTLIWGYLSEWQVGPISISKDGGYVVAGSKGGTVYFFRGVQGGITEGVSPLYRWMVLPAVAVVMIFLLLSYRRRRTPKQTRVVVSNSGALF